jgi:hypothetical protein
MISDQLNAYSTESPSEALSEALGHAIHESAGAANTHVIVQKIMATGSGWKAVLNYVFEPRATEAADHPKTRRAHVRHALESTALPDADDEQKKAEQHHHEHYVHEMLEEQIYSEIRQIELAQLDMNFESNFIHLYIKDSDESVFRAIESRFNFDSVHVLSGPLWEEANRRHPDMELYEAAHNVKGQPKPKKQDKPEKEPKYQEELIDKLSY